MRRPEGAPARILRALATAAIVFMIVAALTPSPVNELLAVEAYIALAGAFVSLVVLVARR